MPMCVAVTRQADCRPLSVVVILPLAQFAAIDLLPLLPAFAHVENDLGSDVNNDTRDDEHHNPESFGHNSTVEKTSSERV